MKRPSGFVAIMGALLSLSMLSACVQGGGDTAAELADTPEGQAFLYRQAVMRIAQNKMGTIGAMARGEAPLDEEVFVKATQDLEAVSGMLEEGFMPEGVPTGSRSLPEVWSNWADFQQKAADFRNAAQSLAEAATTGGFDAAQALVQDTAGTCGGCHRTYRERTE